MTVSHRLSEEREKLLRALEESPGDAELMIRMGRLEFSTGRLDEAERLFRDAVRIAETAGPDVGAERGDTHRKNGRGPDAGDHLVEPHLDGLGEDHPHAGQQPPSANQQHSFQVNGVTGQYNNISGARAGNNRRRRTPR